MTPKQALAALERRAETLARQLEADTAALAQARATGLPRLLFLVDDEYRLAMARSELDFVRALVADLRAKQLTWSEAYIRRVAARMEGAGAPGRVDDETRTDPSPETRPAGVAWPLTSTSTAWRPGRGTRVVCTASEKRGLQLHAARAAAAGCA